MKRLALFPSALVLLAGAVGSSSSVAFAASPGAAVDMKTGNPAAAVSIAEDGSSLLAPYLTSITPLIASAYPHVTLASAAGGSGKGVSDATTGVVQMGGSDAYLPRTDFTQYPTVQNIPIVVASQSIDYNLAGVKNLKLSGNIVAQIYQGKITKWNAPAIASINKGVKLPAKTIVPIVRSDSSGDTFNFTSFLSATNKTWGGPGGPMFNTTVTWPTVQGELTASGNPGMVQSASQAPGSIAYVGSSAQLSANAAKLGQAKLQNAAGKYLLPTAATVTAAVNASKSKVPANLAVSLIYANGATSYPIVNFEYLVVKGPQSSADVAMGIRDMLAFAINPKQGSSPNNLVNQGFVPLPKSIVPSVQAAIAKIN